MRTAYLSLLLVAALSTSCGGDSEEQAGLRSSDPKEVIRAWTDIACDGADVTHISDTDLATTGNSVRDIDYWLTCYPDSVAGTPVEKFQGLVVLRTPEAFETFKADKGCQHTFDIAGERWLAWTQVSDIATDLVTAGGTLCQ